MSDIVGIDLGTTNSLIGVMDAGFPILIADAEGARLTPSVVNFSRDGEVTVGRLAERRRVLEPERTIFSVKRLMGLRAGEAIPELPYALGGERGRAVTVRTPEGLEKRPEEVSAEILRKLRAEAEAAFGKSFDRAVITVPAYFNDAQRQATKAAGELAGFTVERIVNEPTAAALAYGLDKLSERSRVAVYDLGGGTFDISILELNAGVFQVVATNGDTRLGGDDIDRALLEAVRQKSGFAGIGPEGLARLREAVVGAKHRLSEAESTRIELPFFQDGKSLSVGVTRAELEALAGPVIERTRAHCRRAFADADLSAAALDEILLVGGSTRLPLVRRLVAEIFGREPNLTQNPDEAVALGATLQGGILSGAVRNMVLLDVTPLSLGIETFGGLMNVIIPRNSTIPVKMGEMFTNALPNQRAMAVRILQGEREMARDNWPLGEVEIEFEPAGKGQARVGVQFAIDADGILRVLARDTKTGREREVAITSAVDVSDEAVERMVAASVEHAFDDMSERVFTEAKLQAEEMLRAVENALKLVGNDLSPADQVEIERLAGEVRSALAAGEAPVLKQANARLDTATQELATMVVEKAMEEALRRKGVL